MALTKTIVLKFYNGTEIICFADDHDKSYKVRFGKKYIGKTSNGGYKSLSSAVKYAVSVE